MTEDGEKEMFTLSERERGEGEGRERGGRHRERNVNFKTFYRRMYGDHKGTHSNKICCVRKNKRESIKEKDD